MTRQEAERFVQQRVSVEEKVDGANLGIWMSDAFELRFQNRGKFVTAESGAQWRALDEWARRHSGDLYDLLAPFERDGQTVRRVLFGEWLLARHSVPYARLPDYFLAFDIYEDGHLLSVASRNALLEPTGIAVVRSVAPPGIYTLAELETLVENSFTAYGDEDVHIEGVYLKADEENDAADDGEANARTPTHNVARAKIVRKEFIQAIDKHWSKKDLQKNTIVWT